MPSVDRINQGEVVPALRPNRNRQTRLISHDVTAFVQPVLTSIESLSATQLLLTFAASVEDFPGLTHVSSYHLTRDSDVAIIAVSAVSFDLTNTEITLTTAARAVEAHTLVIEW